MPADQLTAERLGCGLAGGAPGSADAAPQASEPAKPSSPAKPGSSDSSDGELTIVPVGDSGPSKYEAFRAAVLTKALPDTEQQSN